MTDEFKAIEESAKAGQEIAKTAGKVVDTSQMLGSFIARFISGPLEQGIGIVEDKLKYMRWERQVRLMQRAEEFMAHIGLTNPTRLVPLKVAVPLKGDVGSKTTYEIRNWVNMVQYKCLYSLDTF